MHKDLAAAYNGVDMAKKKRINYRKDLRVESLPIDLRAMADEPIEAITARAETAAAAAVETFDTATGFSFPFSGKAAAPMFRDVKTSKRGVTILCIVSDNPVKTKYLACMPTLDRDTTGRNRQPILVSGRKDQWVQVPNGFIWNHRIFRRVGETRERRDGTRGSKITTARPWLVGAGADPSPANVLAETQQQVTDAVVTLLLHSLEE